jgi:hypothetical protein
MTSRKKSRITPEMIERITGAFQMGADWSLAAGIAGLRRTALHDFADKHPAAASQWAEARDRADEIIVKRLYDKAKDGDTVSMIFWLKNRKPLEWRDRREIVGDPKAPIALLWLDEPETSVSGGET